MVGLFILASCAARSAAPRPLAWQGIVLPTPSGGGRAQPGAVAAGPPWLIGGAIQLPGQAEPVPAVWSSADGRIWQTRAMRSITPDGAHTRILSLAVHGAVQVALGNRPSPLHGNARPTVWRAVGGGPFVEIPITRELFGGPDLVSFGAVTAGPEGFLVAGSWTTPAGVSAAIWSSPDGLAWARLDSPAQFEPSDGSIVEGVAASSGAGEVTLVGRMIGGAGGPAGGLRPAAWRAPAPGGPWTSVALEPPSGTGSIVGVAGGVAVGWVGSSHRVAVWSPVAGETWRVSELPGHLRAPPPGRDLAGISVASANGGPVILAVAGAPGSSLWLTPGTGPRWSRVELPPGASGAGALPVATDGHAALLLDLATGALWMAGIA